ncbi:hypothetical protein J6590_004716 [Homalodisca vitripennis]|nr:hypothetical protein J6590_004716 [Homalodisca vitripennis]
MKILSIVSSTLPLALDLSSGCRIYRSFVSRRIKENWLRAVRTKKNLNAADIHPSITRSNVYVNEHVTPHNKLLLGKTLYPYRLKRQGKIFLAGFFNGKVIMKAAEALRVTMTGSRQVRQSLPVS